MPVEHYLMVGSTLFALGAIGFLTRRNLILMMLSGELMLHGVGINLTAFSQYHHHYDGQAFTAFVLAVAACEAGLGLSIVLALYRKRQSLDVRLWSTLGEAEPVEMDLPAPEPITPEAVLPRLAPAGRAPVLPQKEGATRA